jgi:hypothetical protein
MKCSRKRLFSIFIKAIEKERADEMSEVAHYTTKKVGGTDGNKGRKKQATKPQRAETKPAPNGQRIVPVIDPAYIKKVTEELLKRNRVCLKSLSLIFICKKQPN